MSSAKYVISLKGHNNHGFFDLEINKLPIEDKLGLEVIHISISCILIDKQYWLTRNNSFLHSRSAKVTGLLPSLISELTMTTRSVMASL